MIDHPTKVNAVSYQSGSYSSVSSVWLDVDFKNFPLLPLGVASTETSNMPRMRLKSDFGITTNNAAPARVLRWIDLSDSTDPAHNAASVTAIGTTAPLIAQMTARTPTVRFDGSTFFSLSTTEFQVYQNGYFFVLAKPRALSPGNRIIDLATSINTDNVQVRIADSGSFATYSVYSGTTPSSINSSTPLTSGKFQLITAIQSGSTPYPATVRIDGQPGSSSNLPAPSSANNRGNGFIGRAASGSNFFIGDISDIVAYNLASPLSSSQVAGIEALLIQSRQSLSQTPRNPVFNLSGGTLLTPAQLVISTDIGALTFLTRDGSSPTNQSEPYNGKPVLIDYSQTIKAISQKNGVLSGVTSAQFTLDPAQFPPVDQNDMVPPTINLELPAPSL